MRNFNKVFRKDMTYDNIKSHKKARLHTLSRRHIFRKKHRWVKLYTTPPPPPPLSFFRVKLVEEIDVRYKKIKIKQHKHAVCETKAPRVIEKINYLIERKVGKK